MNEAEKSRFRDEVDDFITSPKCLCGPPPLWEKESRPDEVGIRWPVVAEDGDEDKAELAFLYRTESPEDKSVTLVYRKLPVCRIDLKPRDHRHINADRAESMGLPGTIFGSHAHLWLYNREHVLRLPLAEWKIPVKVEISPNARSYVQILHCICDRCHITRTPDQLGIAPPTEEELNELLS